MNNNSDLIYTNMFNKLRERTGKQFAKKYLLGGTMYNPFAESQFQFNLTNPLLSLPNGMYRSTVPGLEGKLMGIPDISVHPTDPFEVKLNPFSILDIPTTEQSEFDRDYASWNNANDAILSAKEARRSIDRDDYDSFAEYRQALMEATTLVQDARLDRRSAAQTIGGGLAKRDARRERMAERAERLQKRQDKITQNTADFAAATGLGGSADGTIASAVGNFIDGNFGTGAIDLAVAGMKAVDNLTMGDKNFSTQSEAIDGAVHGASGLLLKSGNPYAMLAGVALEGANFLSKAGGLTVQGFDVDINSSGYGTLGHLDSSSSRSLPFLGGVADAGKIQRKLTERNQQAQMAMNAANIANEQKFEQEARMNSIQDTIINNQIALSGGLDTNLLGG